MTNQFSQIRWGRVLWTALTVYGTSFLFVFLVVTGYASYLAFQARGAPDITMIQEFAGQYAPWISSMSLILFTFLGAMWMAGFIRTEFQLHGLLVGVLVSLVNMIFEGANALAPDVLITTLLIIGGGWLGGRIGIKS